MIHAASMHQVGLGSKELQLICTLLHQVLLPVPHKSYQTLQRNGEGHLQNIKQAEGALQQHGIQTQQG